MLVEELQARGCCVSAVEAGPLLVATCAGTKGRALWVASQTMACMARAYVQTSLALPFGSSSSHKKGLQCSTVERRNL